MDNQKVKGDATTPVQDKKTVEDQKAQNESGVTEPVNQNPGVKNDEAAKSNNEPEKSEPKQEPAKEGENKEATTETKEELTSENNTNVEANKSSASDENKTKIDASSEVKTVEADPENTTTSSSTEDQAQQEKKTSGEGGDNVVVDSDIVNAIEKEEYWTFKISKNIVVIALCILLALIVEIIGSYYLKTWPF